MLRSVPAATSRFLGTIAVLIPSFDVCANFTWLPFWEIGSKPAAFSFRTTSRYVSGLCSANLGLNLANGWGKGRLRVFVVQLERFPQAQQGLLFRFPLAGHIYVKALCNPPGAFLPDTCGETHLHLPDTLVASVYRRLGL